MARIIANVKDTKISDLPDKIKAELDAHKPVSYSISSPVFDTDDNKFHVIIVMETFE